MTDCIQALYFPENGDDDTIHALARKEFFRVQGLMRHKYDTEEEPGDSDSSFDAVENEFEQAVYARIRIDSHAIQVVTTRQEMIRKIREAVEKPMQLSLFYDIGRGGFAVDAEAVCNTSIHNPFDGVEIPDKTI